MPVLCLWSPGCRLPSSLFLAQRDLEEVDGNKACVH